MNNEDMIIEKWNIYNGKPQYRIMGEEIINDYSKAQKKLEAYKLLNNIKDQSYFILPCNPVDMAQAS